MRAHAEVLNLHAQAESFQQHQRRKPAPLELIRHQEAEGSAGHRRDNSEDSVNIAMGMRAYRAQASAIAYPSQHRQQQQRRTSPAARGLQLPDMSEEFHANTSGAGYVQQQPNRLPQLQSVPKQMHNSNIHPPHVNARLGRGATSMNDITSLQHQEQQKEQTHYHNHQHSHQTQQHEQQQQQQHPTQPFSPDVSEYDYHNTHTRSTTHPHRTTSNLHQHRHFQHNSMSVLNSNTSSNLNNNSNNSNNNNNNNNNNMYDHEQQLADTTVNNNRSSVGNNTDVNTNTNSNNYENSKSHAHLHRSSAYQDHPHQNPDIYDQGDSMLSSSFISPSLVSPSLTFSPHTPASTLSPATPFFGSFSSSAQIAEAFADRVQIGIGLGNPGGEDLMMQKNSKIRTESH
ncbi:hypothetical protein BDQ12DRAFT_397116 [Crucibulum laeve]|uniref:Uncharacterized protein n=1 Tax=Crucibulum laeve TaxID=68775 RepID=A0A5C3MKZ0_9AGAR|nr:hypothetical protein BDQ12DRAFT_397116 [Crucibulum laeve]